MWVRCSIARYDDVWCCLLWSTAEYDTFISSAYALSLVKMSCNYTSWRKCTVLKLDFYSPISINDFHYRTYSNRSSTHCILLLKANTQRCAACVMTAIFTAKAYMEDFQLISAVIKPTGVRRPQHWSSLFGSKRLPWANAWWRFNCMCFCVIMSSPLCRQMLLPEGIRRENNKMYEEVEIPPNEPMPIGFEEKPVYISELDEVSGDLFTAVDIYQCLCSHSMSFSQLITLISPVYIDWWHYA